MNQSKEVASYLHAAGVADSLPAERKNELVVKLMNSFPVSLDPLTCFTDDVVSMDIDEWTGSLEQIKKRASVALRPGKYLLYVRASPKAFLIEALKDDLLKILFDPDFVFSFAVFTETMQDLLLEDDSGRICAFGCFSELI